MHKHLIESVRALAEAQSARGGQGVIVFPRDLSLPALLAAAHRAERIEKAAAKLTQHLEFTYGPISPSLSPTKILVCELNAALSEPQ